MRPVSAIGGEWVDDQPSGEGEAVLEDGSNYSGTMKNSKLNGQGKKVFPNGRMYTGNWKDGVPDGEGCEFIKVAGSSILVNEGSWQ